jgi:hypothetical protein
MQVGPGHVDIIGGYEPETALAGDHISLRDPEQVDEFNGPEIDQRKVEKIMTISHAVDMGVSSVHVFLMRKIFLVTAYQKE